MSHRRITFIQAVREAFQEEMRRDERVFILGQDVRAGIFGTTSKLVGEFGEDRVINTPICESASVGAAVGAAMTGLRPVVQIMFGDFNYLAMEITANQAGQWHYLSDGALKVPMVIETPSGARGGAGYGHSQSLEAAFILPPGLKVAVPSTPYDAKGLLKSAIRDDNPVLFFEHRRLLTQRGHVPEEEYLIPLGQADIKREGKDVTLVALSATVQKALSAAERLSQQGIEVEVIDPRTLVPLDKETIFKSLQKTYHLVVVEEGRRRGGFGAELTAIAAEEWFDTLDAPVQRLGTISAPLPYSPVLEAACIPSEDDIVRAVLRSLGQEE
ncbi:MAG: alpha-ketoacid dehydrogenase subunit beta [Chloroflexi bacterium]|nr:alpha-ketoacid dehydrogenase subunit beta [Chloroflexota bacterium]